jgi:hypothetical protein
MTTEVIILSLVILAIWVWALILFIPTIGKAFLVFKGHGPEIRRKVFFYLSSSALGAIGIYLLILIV